VIEGSQREERRTTRAVADEVLGFDAIERCGAGCLSTGASGAKRRHSIGRDDP
jgi:hypothetical protein